MSDNGKIYIQLEPEHKESGYGALCMAGIAAACLFGAITLIETVIIAAILLVASIIFAWIGLFMCQRIRKRGGSLSYSRTLATLGYIICMCIIIASVACAACVASVGGCFCRLSQECAALFVA